MTLTLIYTHTCLYLVIEKIDIDRDTALNKFVGCHRCGHC